MFDYTVLVDEVRRLINDEPEKHIDTQESTMRSTYYFILTNEGYATIPDGGCTVNGVVLNSSEYTIDKNIVRFNNLIPTGSEIVINYSIVQYTDDMLIDYIGDAIHTLVEPIFHVDFEFGVNIPAEYSHPETITLKDISRDIRALFVYGAVIEILGIQIIGASGDAIYIKDGDTIIDTASSSREVARGYQPIIDRWNYLLKTVQINNFEGAYLY